MISAPIKLILLEPESIVNIPINVEVRRIIKPIRFEKIMFTIKSIIIVDIVNFL